MRRSSPSPIGFYYYCACVSAAVLIAGSGHQWAVEANFHTEGGNFKLPVESASGLKNQQQQYYDVELADEQQQQPVGGSALEGIVEQLNQQLRRESEAYDEQQQQQDVEGLPTLEELVPQVAQAEQQKSGAKSNFRQRQQEINTHANAEIEELQRLGHKFKELSSQGKQEEQPEEAQNDEVEQPTEPKEDESEDKKAEEKPLTAQKKGQSEFVEFIEPPVHASKMLKNKEHLEKRVEADDERAHHHGHGHHYRAWNLLSSSGNVIFIAFVTMCCVFSVVGVVGGMYYYNHVKSAREDPFDDFTRYSPAGPGRDKLKKGRGGQQNAFGGEKGDDTLAYKAQLHHYQQTKQKIIGEQAGVGGDVDASDKSDDEADLEHNFSVYECPGLAPTGDIEVQNPNFIESPTSGKKTVVTMSP